MSCGWFVCRVPFWFCVLRGLVVSCWLGVVCAKIQFFALETCIFLSPWYYRIWERYYRFGRHGTTVSGHGTTAPSRARGGYDSGRGVPTPHTHSLSLSPRLSLSRTVPEALAGSPSPATLLGFRPVGSFPTTSSCHGPRFFPKSLFFLAVLLLLGFWGETCHS